MKKVIIYIVCLILACAEVAGNNVDSLYNQYTAKKSSQRFADARRLINIFVKEECFDYPVTNRHLSNHKMTDMLTCLGMANYEYDHANFLHAVRCAEKALQYVPEDSLCWMSSCYEVANVALQRIGDYNKALEYARLDYDVGKKINNKEILSSSLNSLAAIMLATNHTEEGLPYIQQAVDIERQNKSDNGKKLAIRLGIQCEMLMKLNRQQEALDCINEALTIDSCAQRLGRVGVRKSQKADILLSMHEWEECEKICTEALNIFDDFGNTMDKIIALKQLGTCEIEMKKYQLAEKHLLEGERLCKETSFTAQLWRIQHQLFTLYKKTGQPERALVYLEQCFDQKDSLNNDHFQQLLSEYQVAYETNAKDIQIEAQQKIMRVRLIWMIIILFLLAMLIVSLIVAFRLARIRKNNNKRLEEVNTTRNQIFSIVSHDLKNPVNAQKKILDYMCGHFDQISEPDKKEQINALKQSSDSLNDLLVNLLEWASLESGRLTYKPIRIDLNTLVNTCVRHLQPFAEEKNVTIHKELQPDLFVHTDIKFLEIIMRNLLHNAVKFSFVGGEMEIVAAKDKKNVSLQIVDHGIGMQPDIKKKVFTKEIMSTLGTSNETGTGIGLMICKALIDKSNCLISFTSEPMKGSAFTILLPLSE